MKVILLEDMEKLGKKGDVVDVKPGYANNYLFSRDLAVKATPEELENLEKIMAQREEEQAQAKAEAESIAQKLATVEVTIPMKVGEAGRLFGTVTNQDIADVLKKDYDIQVDRRKIVLDEKIKALGTYELPVKLHPEVPGQVKVNITEA